MVDKKSWQVEQTGKPTGHHNNMKRFNPKHRVPFCHSKKEGVLATISYGRKK